MPWSFSSSQTASSSPDFRTTVLKILDSVGVPTQCFQTEIFPFHDGWAIKRVQMLHSVLLVMRAGKKKKGGGEQLQHECTGVGATEGSGLLHCN